MEKIDHKNEVKNEPDEEKEEIKKSYVERALYSYLKNFFSQGFKRLLERQYAPYFYYVILLTGISIIISIYHSIILANPQIPLGNSETIKQILQYNILLCIFSGVGLIFGGFIGGLLKDKTIQNIITIILLITGAGLLFFPISYESIILEILKLILFLVYVCIASISLFFIIISFVTALSYRVINLGNARDRLLFQGILRFLTWVSLPMYGYLFIQGTLDAQILAGAGLIVTSFLLFKLYNLPTIDKSEKFDEKLDKKSILNYFQVIGFFNLYLLYQLSQSFGQSQTTNLTVDFILLALNTVYMINRLSKKVDQIQDEEELERTFLFQRKTGIAMRIKKRLGEKTMILMMLGLALGYHAVYLDSYLNTDMQIIAWLSDPSTTTELNLVYHRTFLGFGLLIIVLSYITIQKSPRFQRVMINRYSMRHVLRMFADLFRTNEEGTTGAVLAAYESGKEKVNQEVQKFKKGLKNRWDRFFSLGGEETEPPNPNEDED